MDTTFLDHFWQLASLDAEERQNAANGLIVHLNNSYQEFVKSEEKISKFDNIEESSGAIEIIKKASGSDVAYAMSRLTKGIASPRAGARHGFALALTELLASFEFFTFKMILPLIDKACPISPSKDKEGSDKIFGRVLSLMSVIRSGILWRETSSDEDYREVINDLLACANCKPYVRETCYQVIVSSIPLLKETSFEEKAISHLISIMKERNGKSGGINNPDDLNLAIVIEVQYPDIILNNQWKQVMVKWNNPHILHPENLEKLTEVIQAKKPGKAAAEIQQNQENRIHSVWNTILRWIISPPDNKLGKQTVTFAKFWKVAVDECLFDDDATYQRKFWGFQLFEKTLHLCPEEKISFLFTPNFMRTLINHSYEKDRYLHEAATSSLKVIEQVAEENQKKALIIVKQFLGQNYDRDFDKVSKTNTVKKIFSVINNQTIEEYVLYLKSIFIQPDENLSSDHDAIDRRRQWIVNYLYSLLKDSRINRQVGWLRLVLDLFLIYGFYTAKDSFIDDKPKSNKVETGKSESQNKKFKKRNSKRVRFEDQQSVENIPNMDNSGKKVSEYILPKPKISENIQECCRTRFFHSLGELSTFRSLQSNKTEKPSRTRSGFMNDDQTWAYYAVTLMNKFESDNQLEPLIVLSEEAQQLKKAVVELLQKITDKLEKSMNKGSQKSNLDVQQEGFHWLFSYAILALYTEPEEAMNALQDLQQCFNKMFVQSKRSPKKKKNEETAEDNHDPVDVIVDVLLGFLAKPSAFLHKMAEQAFKVFCGFITKSSLDLMLDLISKKRNDEEELVDEMDIDGESNESDDESNENDSDNEETVNGKEGVKDRFTIEFDQQDNENYDDSDEDMSNQDRIMEEFDSKLSEFFKHKKLEKRKKKDAKYQKIHYKHKVIGLLKIFVKEQQNNPLIFDLFIPLLEIAKNAKTDEIAESVFDLLNTKFIVIKDGPTEFDDDKILSLLEKVQDMARKSRFGDMMRLCWEISAFLLKSIVRRYKDEVIKNTSTEITNQHIKKAISIYDSTYKSWCVKSNSLNIKCFSQLPNHIPQIPWHFSEIFLGCTDPKTAKNPKKVMNAYDVSFSICNIALPKKKRESKSAISKLVPKIRDAINNTLQFIAEDLKCGNQNFDSQTLKSVLKFASLAIKRTSIDSSIEELKKLWNAKKFLLLLEKIKELPRFKSSQAINDLVKEIARNFQ
ncbi:DNA polymerase phi-domain-containing protein [Glomus cerebriforme]|uniref:DNA polymerase phi-domain-containing protein n=1 Tax=Glomus cerebriforme TaxID=658196 RepID=A0A397STR4_9GLOM|nr:DNA polymerase phi-domain-containing protein [Glomus cerebriforme]